jgi:SHS2 domain-containing protein
MDGAGEGWPEGVTPLDHTADVGLEVRASSLQTLFERAAAGMRTAIEGPARGPGSADARVTRAIELEAEDVASLLVAWLRELLFVHQVEGLAVRGVRFERLDRTGLTGWLTLEPARARPVREIKGVTYHGLETSAYDGGWRARVIFDV